jgi:hypothetical protein
MTLPRIAPAILSALLPATAEADPLAPHRWQARPVVVFAPEAQDQRLAEQLARVDAARPGMEERDIVVIVDMAPGSALRARFRPVPPADGFTVILVGLDGGEKLRRTGVTDPDRLMAEIDTMPMRRQEMRQDRRTPD